jgi:hypothetical protein
MYLKSLPEKDRQCGYVTQTNNVLKGFASVDDSFGARWSA